MLDKRAALHAELYAEIEAKFPRTNAKNNKNTAASRKTSGRKKVGFSGPDAEGFIQVGVTPGIVRIDSVPSGPPSPPPPNSKKPDAGSIIGAFADEALRPELQGNDEARRLMQETLLDEAAFAAADAADKNSGTGLDDDNNATPRNPSGSPPLNLSYV
ncbi:hypothetical protein AX14_010931 [Amanita brunnescens Koide BX004]|nr:hypothetical protein AX14_010931 [Amanita brunnescens Koide BX004]